MRSRCPYCGARKRKRGKRVAEEDNAVWKLVVGLLLVVILIAAVVVLLVTALNSAGKDSTPDASASASASASPSASFSEGDGVTEVTNSATPPPTTAPTTAPPAVTIQSIMITWLGSESTDVSINVADIYTFGYAVTPAEYTGGTAVWSSSDEAVFVVLQTGQVTATGAGTATLTVTLDGVSATCVVRVSSS